MSIMDKFAEELAARQPRSPGQPYPQTYGPGPLRAKIFDPATKQYPQAYLRGEPDLDPDALQHWRLAQRAAMQHVLQVVADSRWRDHLILRGSAVLATWYGEQAREPRDLDWVVQPKSIRISDRQAHELESELIKGVCKGSPRESDVVFVADAVATDDLWTYDRVPGRRMCLPWTSTDQLSGTVQVDLVYGETVFTLPECCDILLCGENPANLLTATRAESLAWKIMWLTTDAYPQGKDLFDAVLLSADSKLTNGLLDQVCNRYLAECPNLGPGDFARVRDSDWLTRMDETRVDWDNFLKEYPDVPGELAQWMSRIREAVVAATSV